MADVPLAPPAGPTDSAAVPAVLAAGALCWRVKNKQLEVLLIHRPRYDDWSWPKGKYDDGETIPQTAVREVNEEIGLTIQLGLPLPHTDYYVNAGLKRVYYWAAQPGAQTPRADGKEVDSFLWCAPERARRLLSNPSDVGPLDALEEAYRSARLKDSWPLIVVRHAKAKPRSSWTRAEGDRTLAATGQRQAAALKRLLMAWSPLRVVSSPWARCVATVSPYVKAVGAKVKLVDALTEANFRRNPRRTGTVVETLFDKRRPVVLCVHRPTLPAILEQLAQHMSSELEELLPTDDPFLAPGEAIICQVVGDTVVSVEQFKPFDD
ncbi:NUDIX hydrolase [Psychromicrobium xiongbiense]|uniref:NUDIX hydrolase n=1 Tax=Psychromicrobium xiongbiense TaxID=3051184 RepID=UPI0025573EEC|nr:NUDIX hydrolase [Psychromicrobium sp. YIM S02556]